MRAYCAIFLLCCCAALQLQADVVTGHLIDSNGRNATNVTLRFDPGIPRQDGTNFIRSRIVSTTTDTSGNFSIELQAGSYATSDPTLPRDSFRICVQGDGSTNDWQALRCNSTLYAITNLPSTFIAQNAGSGTSNVLSRPRLLLSNGPPTNGWTLIADGTSGFLLWAEAAAGSSGITSPDTGESITSPD